MKKRAEKEKMSSEQLPAEESLRRMRAFAERKEYFIASIKASKDRSLPADKK